MSPALFSHTHTWNDPHPPAPQESLRISNLACLPPDLREPIVYRITLWICSNIYALMLVRTQFLESKAQTHLLARLSSRREFHYDFHGAISSQRGSLCGLDALWHGIQYLFQWFVEEESTARIYMTLTSSRLRCWYHDCHLGR